MKSTAYTFGAGGKEHLILNLELTLLSLKFLLFILDKLFGLTLIGNLVPLLHWAAILLLAVVLAFSKEGMKNALGVVTTAGTVLLLGGLTLYNALFGWDSEEFLFQQGLFSRGLVVEERSFLLGGEIAFYRTRLGVFKQPLRSSASTNNGYRPITAGTYGVVWKGDDVAEVTYDFDGRGEWRTVVLSLF